MTRDNGTLDVVVVGAGAAGIAAARTVVAAGFTCLVLEARTRLGGRAHTDCCGTPWPLDLGCEWLHSADRNILAGLAEPNGFTLDRSEPPWRKRHLQQGFDAAEQDRFGDEQGAFWERMAAAGAEGQRTGIDRPAADLLDPDARYNGFIDAISTYYNGAPLSRVSVIDFDRYLDTEQDWRVEGGYGAMIAALGAELPVRFNCRVTAIDHSGARLRIDTEAGPIEAKRVIVTLPSSVLASGAIRFAPALDDHLHAAAGLPLGLANKVFLRITDPGLFDSDSRLIGSPLRCATGTYTMRSRGRDLVEGYFGGDYARELEKGGLDAFVEAARSEIGEALGRNIGAKLEPIAATRWASDPLALGSYSHALPGHANDRAVLARSVENRLAFAGEATSPQFFSTAHGAWESGERAAHDLIGSDVSRSAPAGRAA